MPIPTPDELKILVQNSVSHYLSTGAVKKTFGLWPQKPHVTWSMFEQVIGNRHNDSINPFGRITMYRPSKAEWGVVGFTIFTRAVTMESFGEHMLRLNLIQEILRSIQADIQAFTSSS